MTALEAGGSASATARQLGVSRQTVWRYQRAAAQQGRRVPQPQPVGGYRWSKLERTELVALSALALAEPKRTLAHLREVALAQHVLPQPVSVATVSRALHKTGLKKRHARFVDLRTQVEPLIVAERQAFRHAQRHEPRLAAERLLFMDETNVYRNEQARRAWGLAEAAEPVLYKPKGRTQSTALFLTLGVASVGGPLLHYAISARAGVCGGQRQHRGLGARRARPRVRVGFDVGHATVLQLRVALRAHNAQWMGARAELVARVRQLVASGRWRCEP